MAAYSPSQVEPRWRAAWENAETFRAVDDDRPKYYVLEMFPYPSGRIHMGHVRNYAMGDVVARFKRARYVPSPVMKRQRLNCRMP